jgi:hypothetical protein
MDASIDSEMSKGTLELDDWVRCAQCKRVYPFENMILIGTSNELYFGCGYGDCSGKCSGDGYKYAKLRLMLGLDWPEVPECGTVYLVDNFPPQC